MAKNKGFFTFLLVLLAGFAVLTGCTGEGAGGSVRGGVNDVNEGKEVDLEPGTFPGLDVETERRILQDYVDRDKEEPWYDGSWAEMLYSQRALEYNGTYNGWVVVRVMVPHAGVIQTVTIDGIEFNDVLPTLIWKDGQIHTLQDAYVAGLLTQDDVRSIYVLLWREK